MHKILESTTEKVKKTQLAAAKQMLTLATNAFGLIAALAWNNVIQEIVNNYVKKYLTYGSGLISLLIYAVLITILAVSVTLNLSALAQKLEGEKEKEEEKKKEEN